MTGLPPGPHPGAASPPSSAGRMVSRAPGVAGCPDRRKEGQPGKIQPDPERPLIVPCRTTGGRIACYRETGGSGDWEHPAPPSTHFSLSRHSGCWASSAPSQPPRGRCRLPRRHPLAGMRARSRRARGEKHGKGEGSAGIRTGAGPVGPDVATFSLAGPLEPESAFAQPGGLAMPRPSRVWHRGRLNPWGGLGFAVGAHA
jgi:hypothetical protein